MESPKKTVDSPTKTTESPTNTGTTTVKNTRSTSPKAKPSHVKRKYVFVIWAILAVIGYMIGMVVGRYAILVAPEEENSKTLIPAAVLDVCYDLKPVNKLSCILMNSTLNKLDRSSPYVTLNQSVPGTGKLTNKNEDWVKVTAITSIDKLKANSGKGKQKSSSLQMHLLAHGDIESCFKYSATSDDNDPNILVKQVAEFNATHIKTACKVLEKGIDLSGRSLRIADSINSAAKYCCIMTPVS
jgi:hypothetical protein